MPRALIVIPTYDEADNVRLALAGVLASTGEGVEVLIVDDASPDGTGDIADQVAGTEPRVHVLHRAAKQGLGPAYLAGFGWALAHGYDAVVEMDADGSHHPDVLPRLLAGLADHDLVLGSRWVAGGRVENWPLHRLLLSRAGNAYARAALGLPVRDATGGFRAFRATSLHRLSLSDVASQGYCFQIDLLRRALQAGLSVTEVPITFTDRTVGRSKMTGRIVLESLLRVTGWAASRRLAQARRRLRTGRRTAAARPIAR